jgi:hypothetical protein
MAGAYGYLWENITQDWKKARCDSLGRLEISENTTPNVSVDNFDELQSILEDIMGNRSKSGVRVHMLANQEIADSTHTLIEFDKVDHDGLGEWDTTNYQFVPEESGRYYISIQGQVDEAVAGRYHLTIKKNDSAVSRGEMSSATNMGYNVVFTSIVMQLEGGDIVNFYVWIDRDVGADASTFSSTQWFSHAEIQRVY